MNGLGLTVTGPLPQFTVTLPLTSALTSVTAGLTVSSISWMEAEDGVGRSARPALAISAREARVRIGRVMPDCSDRAPLGRYQRLLGLGRRFDVRPIIAHVEEPTVGPGWRLIGPVPVSGVT